MGNYTIFWMFENPRRGRQARNFTKNVPKILNLKSCSEQIFSFEVLLKEEEQDKGIARVAKGTKTSSPAPLLAHNIHRLVEPTSRQTD